MKKITIFIALILLCKAGLFAQSGVIKELAGTVELKQAGAAAFVPAKTGDRVAKDTIVSTGFKSSALIEVGSSLIAVRPLTRLTLAEISTSAGSETINVNLQTGRVRVDVNPPAGTKASMEVRGPNATASVRGTSFSFDTYTITVHHGKVAFISNRNVSGGPGRTRESVPTVVNPGASSEIKASGRAVDPVILSRTKLIPEIKKDIDSEITKELLRPFVKSGKPGSASVKFVLK